MSDCAMEDSLDLGGKLILVVDDEFDLLSVYTMLFEYSGFRVRTAGNGRAALEAAALEAPDIVVSDFMMPVMDGGELCRQWRASPQLRAIPFILCSAGIMRNAGEIDCDSFFNKPIDLPEMMKEIKRLLACAK
jgi:CheY-like chemotaxis protein